ncbi:unnamed protein product [Tetraodon nigroviridis]|uniref:Chromosome 3 SCAF14700, whole genome shotgun sequence n=1 Tax=Tetraodon nigroviridis TaxID=99883 RepID=Q4S944_TETNG|nr:unnamed protein product [Tetraodon nigroviridis]
MECSNQNVSTQTCISLHHSKLCRRWLKRTCRT